MDPPQFPDELKTADPQLVQPTLGMDVCKHAVRYQGGLDWVEIVRHQRADVMSDWVSVSGKFTISAKVTEVSYREGGNDLFVAALKGNGEALIERWVFTPREGAYSYGIGSAPPVGQSQPAYHDTAQLLVQGGGAFNAAAAAFLPAPRRSTVFESSSLGIIRDVVVEPAGRFLLFLTHESKSVYRIDLTSGPPFVPTLVLDPNQYPALALAEDLCLWIHVVEGEKYVLRDVQPFAGSPTTILLPDADNDGVLESPSVISHNQWLTSGYATGSVWKRLFEAQ